MVAIQVSAFTGENPLIIPRLLPETSAVEVYNARLNDGGLTPINYSILTGATCPLDTETIFKHGTEWHYWNKRVNVVAAPVATDRLYVTGDGKPKLIVGGITLDLAVPRPTGSVTATVSGTGTGDVYTRTYVYTFVTEHGEESAPSPASNLVDWNAGKTITLSGISLPAAGRDITKQRFYRSQTGTAGTYFYFIAERDATDDDFVDDIGVDEFQEVIPSIGWDEPPDDLAGLIAMPNGMMAAFTGKEVHFCEPWRPHTWPQKYSMACDAKVVALAAIGEALIVLTEAQPYIMSGSHPDSMHSIKLQTNHPCINARGVVDLGFCIAYPSHAGLIAIAGDGSVRNLTETLFSHSGWQALSPKTIVGAQIHGAYALFYDRMKGENRSAGCLFVYPGGTPFIIRSSEIVKTCHYVVQDSALYFTRDGDPNIYQFDPPDGEPETLYWKSKEWWLPRPMNFAVFKAERGSVDQNFDVENRAEQEAAIDQQNQEIFDREDFPRPINSDGINCSAINDDALLPYPPVRSFQAIIIGDGKIIANVEKLDAAARLPSNSMHEVYQVAISTNIPIGKFKLCQSMSELRVTP